MPHRNDSVTPVICWCVQSTLRLQLKGERFESLGTTFRQCNQIRVFIKEKIDQTIKAPGARLDIVHIQAQKRDEHQTTPYLRTSLHVRRPNFLVLDSLMLHDELPALLKWPLVQSFHNG